MSKFFHLAKKQNRRVRRHNRKLFPTMKTDIKTFNVIIGILIVVIAVSYLVQVNGLATKGYQIKDLESKIAELEQEQADLELESLSLQSMGAVKEKVDGMGMVLAGAADYLSPTPVAVAR